MGHWSSEVARLREPFMEAAKGFLGEAWMGDVAISAEGLDYLEELLDTEQPSSVLELGAGLSSLLFRMWANARSASTVGDASKVCAVTTLDHDRKWLEFVERFCASHDLRLPETATVKWYKQELYRPGAFDLILVDHGPTMQDRLDDLDWILAAAKPAGRVVFDDWRTHRYARRPSTRWTEKMAAELCRVGWGVEVVERSRECLAARALAVAHRDKLGVKWTLAQTPEADLSERDAVVLYEWMADRHVVEVGSGGSTPMLARVARSLVSYETDESWFVAVRDRLLARGLSHVDYRLSKGVDPKSPAADVYFVDCSSRDKLRSRWIDHIERNHLARIIIIHDSRRESPLNDLGWLFSWPRAARLDRVYFHYMNSNCIVVVLREEPVVYINWRLEQHRKPMRVK